MPASCQFLRNRRQQVIPHLGSPFLREAFPKEYGTGARTRQNQCLAIADRRGQPSFDAVETAEATVQYASEERRKEAG